MVQVLRGTEDTHFNRFLRENKSWKEYLDAFKEKMSLAESGQAQNLIEKCYKSYPNDYKGTYVHPKLINYIAIWASPNYDIYVGDIMDQINDKVREELNKQQLPDTVENSKPIVNEIVKSIAPNIHINNSST